MSTAHLLTQVEIKAVDTSQRLITGYAGAIGNLDRVGDVIDKGAFDRTLKENQDVLVLVGHDASRMPVGEPTSMVADNKGLLTTSRIYKTAAGDELLEVASQRLAAGKTLGMSIGYRVTPGGSKFVGAVRHIKDLDLVEYSYLASPVLAANPQATVIGVKARKEMGGTSTLEASYEDLQGDLARACALSLGVGWVDVCATYTDHVVIRISSYSIEDANTPEDEADSQFWDFPYTLGDDGEPTIGTPKPVQPAFVAGAAKEWIVVDEKAVWSTSFVNNLPDSAFALILPGGTKDSDGKTTPRNLRKLPHHGTGGAVDDPHLRNALSRAPQMTGVTDAEKSAAEAHLERHAKAEGIGKSNPDRSAAIVDLNKLPDSSFAFIAPGGTLDEEKMTVPRASRHYAHHNDEGKLDADLLSAAITEAVKDGAATNVVAHLKRHAFKAGVVFWESNDIDDAHSSEFATGATPALFVLAGKMTELIDKVIGEHISMKHLGIDTKGGAKLQGESRQALRELLGEFSYVLDQADLVERGADGTARVDVLSRRLQLLEV